MTLPSSGPLTFTEIETEFGSNGNRGLGRYRADSIHFTNKTVGDLGRITEGGYLPLDDGIPKSGTIKFSDFRGKSQNVIVDCHSAGGDHINAKTDRWDSNDVLVVGGYKNPSQKKESGSKIIIHINKTFKSVHSTTANTCALRTGEWNSIAGMRVDLGDNAKLYGAGGNGGLGADHGQNNGGAGKPGNSGLGIEMNNTIVNVNSGALIQCGYGGGGGGGHAAKDPDKSTCDPSQGGSGGGGGAGFPNGSGGIASSSGIGGNNGQNSTNEVHGNGGTAVNRTACNTDTTGGAGGDGGDQNQVAQQGGNSNGSYGGQDEANGGNFGYNGDAIRVVSGSGSYSLSGNAALGNVVTGSTVS